jgi:Icc-related predicted phosphoesterase
MAQRKDTIRLAAMADPHFTRASQGTLQPLLADLNDRADVLLVCGDLTDHGLPEEAQVLAKELTAVVRIPMAGVLGNHDFESGKADEVQRILCDAGLHVLDGDTFEARGVGFAGVKGFCGGFGRHVLGPWGEDGIKRFVHDAVEEALKLEAALAKLRTPQRVALLHYSPVRDTVEGEPLEIFPFLGSSRLEEPLNRAAVTVAFHGHAHHGSPEGQTGAGIPVYNVSMKLLLRVRPEHPPYRVVEVPAAPRPETVVTAGSEDKGHRHGHG